MKTVLAILVLCFLATATHAQCGPSSPGYTKSGQTYTATTPGPADVQAAFTAESATPADGDVIAIPAGSCTWTVAGNVISFTTAHNVTIQGAGAMAPVGSGGTTPVGTDQTAITDQLSNTSELFSLGESTPGKVLRFTGIAILQNGSSNVAQFGLISVGGPNNSIRVDHCHFYLTVSGGSSVYVGEGNTTGVADHNYLQSVANADMDTFDVYNGIGWGGVNDNPNATGQQIQGNASWNDTDHFGSSEFFFVEDSYFSYGWFGNCVVGGRWVFRHNTSSNTNGTAEHGTTFYERSCRAAEFYDNNLTGAPQAGQSNSAYSNNGGTTMWWGNTVASGYPNAITLDVPRRNNAYSGCCSVPPSGWGYCGTNFDGTGSPWDGNSNTATGYPCMDGPARGKGDFLGNPPGTTTGNFPFCNITQSCTTNNGQWPRQALSPIYAWANTLSGSTLLINDNSGGLTPNQDYYTDSVGGGFNGTAGIGTGTLLPTNSSAYTNAPNCTTNPNAGTMYNTGGVPGVGYWYTGVSGTTPALYVCTATNTWTLYYTPYTYPHPLQGGGSMSLSPTSKNFGAVNLGSSSTPLTFTLTNNSTSSATSLTISNIGNNTADFVISSNTCGSTLAASSSCTFNVTFTPVTGIGRSTTLTATYSGADGAGKQTAALSGTTNGTSAASIMFAGTTFLNGETLLP